MTNNDLNQILSTPKHVAEFYRSLGRTEMAERIIQARRIKQEIAKIRLIMSVNQYQNDQKKG